MATTGFVFAWVIKVPVRLANPWINSVTEAQPVWGALQIAASAPLLTDYRTSIPCVPITYGVLTYWLPGFLSPGSAGDAVVMAVTGRTLSLIAFLAAAVFTLILARQRGVKFPFAALALAPLFWMPYCTEWATKFMPDFPALAWSLAGLVILGIKSSKFQLWKVTPVLAAVCWTIAWHYKPITLAGPVLCLAEALAVARNRAWPELKFKAATLLLYVLQVAISVIILQVITRGLWYLNVVETAAQCRWIPANPLQLLRERPGSGLLPALFFLAAVRLRSSPLAFAVIVLIPLELVFIMKEGSNINYVIGSLVLGGIFLAVEAQRAWETLEWKPVPYALTSGAVVCLLTVVLSTGFSASTVFFEETPVQEADVSILRAAVTPYEQGRVLSLHPWLALRLGLPSAYMDGFHAQLLIREGLVDFAALRASISRQEYDLIIPATVFTPELLTNAVSATYQPTTQIGGITVFEPKVGISAALH